MQGQRATKAHCRPDISATRPAHGVLQRWQGKCIGAHEIMLISARRGFVANKKEAGIVPASLLLFASICFSLLHFASV